jgi:hypothetical protein
VRLLLCNGGNYNYAALAHFDKRFRPRPVSLQNRDPAPRIRELMGGGVAACLNLSVYRITDVQFLHDSIVLRNVPFSVATLDFV